MAALVVGGCLALQGCTYRAWFEGFKAQQRQECYKYAAPSERQSCLDRVNRMTYDEYERARKHPAN